VIVLSQNECNWGHWDVVVLIIVPMYDQSFDKDHLEWHVAVKPEVTSHFIDNLGATFILTHYHIHDAGLFRDVVSTRLELLGRKLLVPIFDVDWLDETLAARFRIGGRLSFQCQVDEQVFSTKWPKELNTVGMTTDVVFVDVRALKNLGDCAKLLKAVVGALVGHNRWQVLAFLLIALIGEPNVSIQHSSLQTVYRECVAGVLIRHLLEARLDAIDGKVLGRWKGHKKHLVGGLLATRP